MIRLAPAHGRGALLLLLTVGCQAAVLALSLARPSAPPPPEPRLTLSAAAVMEPRLAGTPQALDRDSVLGAGSRVQLSFETGTEAWVAALWFDGGDGLVPLYPDPSRGQRGWTAAGTTYAVPGPSSWLRPTATGPEGDLLVVVAGARPDPAVVAALNDPRPDVVRALREQLEARAAARREAVGGPERFLPTADGRAVAVPWRSITGTGSLVIVWRIAVDSAPWAAPSMSSSSAPGSPARSSPNAS